VPWKFEAGTPPVAEAVGLHAAVGYLSAVGLPAIHDHAVALVSHARAVLGALPGVTLYGPVGPAVGGAMVAFNLFDADGHLLHPHDVGTFLDQEGVAIRAGHHCAKPLHRRLGLSASCRASGYLYTEPADFLRLAAALERARAFFSRHRDR
jgi:cysteine desulfurase/selenocysteine lyase